MRGSVNSDLMMHSFRSFLCIKYTLSVPFVDAVVDGARDSVETVVVSRSFPLHLLVVQHTELQELIS